jgi:hypothetical protein
MGSGSWCCHYCDVSVACFAEKPNERSEDFCPLPTVGIEADPKKEGVCKAPHHRWSGMIMTASSAAFSAHEPPAMLGTLANALYFIVHWAQQQQQQPCVYHC